MGRLVQESELGDETLHGFLTRFGRELRELKPSPASPPTPTRQKITHHNNMPAVLTETYAHFTRLLLKSVTKPQQNEIEDFFRGKSSTDMTGFPEFTTPIAIAILAKDVMSSELAKHLDAMVRLLRFEATFRDDVPIWKTAFSCNLANSEDAKNVMNRVDVFILCDDSMMPDEAFTVFPRAQYFYRVWETSQQHLHANLLTTIHAGGCVPCRTLCTCVENSDEEVELQRDLPVGERFLQSLAISRYFTCSAP
jgi:hypothetical protein